MNETKDPLIDVLKQLRNAVPEAPHDLGVRLEAAFRHHHARRRRILVAQCAGLAACLMIAAVFIPAKYRLSQGSRRAPVAPASSALPATLTTNVPDQQGPAPHQKGSHQAEGRITAPGAPQAFAALPGVDGRTLSGSWTIVRLKLSRADLGLVGVPDSGENPYDLVVADVLMDEDGTPYAVRVVN